MFEKSWQTLYISNFSRNYFTYVWLAIWNPSRHKHWLFENGRIFRLGHSKPDTHCSFHSKRKKSQWERPKMAIESPTRQKRWKIAIRQDWKKETFLYFIDKHLMFTKTYLYFSLVEALIKILENTFCKLKKNKEQYRLLNEFSIFCIKNTVMVSFTGLTLKSYLNGP